MKNSCPVAKWSQTFIYLFPSSTNILWLPMVAGTVCTLGTMLTVMSKTNTLPGFLKYNVLDGQYKNKQNVINCEQV